MPMNRRGFLKTCLILGVAPAIVRADSLMRIIPQEISIYVPDAYPVILVQESFISAFAYIDGVFRPSIDMVLANHEMIKAHLPSKGRVRYLRLDDDNFVKPIGYGRGGEPKYERTIRTRAQFMREVIVYPDD